MKLPCSQICYQNSGKLMMKIVAGHARPGHQPQVCCHACLAHVGSELKASSARSSCSPLQSSVCSGSPSCIWVAVQLQVFEKNSRGGTQMTKLTIKAG